VCVFQDSEGYDAIRLAQQLTSRKLSDGASLAVVAITGKLLDAEWEHYLAAPEMPFTRVLFTNQTAKGRSAESGRLGCDYNIRVWYDEGDYSSNQPANALSPPSEVNNPVPLPSAPPMIGYELRRAGREKVLARGSAPPRTVYRKTGRWEFNPYPLFANQIVKKLNSAR
jgi:hypothetical protein